MKAPPPFLLGASHPLCQSARTGVSSGFIRANQSKANLAASVQTQKTRFEKKLPQPVCKRLRGLFRKSAAVWAYQTAPPPAASCSWQHQALCARCRRSE